LGLQLVFLSDFLEVTTSPELISGNRPDAQKILKLLFKSQTIRDPDLAKSMLMQLDEKK
jgi:hypothetical protein